MKKIIYSFFAVLGLCFTITNAISLSLTNSDLRGTPGNMESCVGIPSNASRNSVSSILTTFVNGVWNPSINAVYNTTPSSTECRYKCNNLSNFELTNAPLGMGPNHNCVLTNDGNVDCRGNDEFIYIYYYHGITLDYGEGDAVTVKAGYGQNCLLTTNGTVKCNDGSLGYPTASWEDKLYGMVDFAMGYNYVCGLEVNGNVSCAGDPVSSTPYNGGDAIKISTNNSSKRVVLKENGNVYIWGGGESMEYTGGDAVDIDSICLITEEGNVKCLYSESWITHGPWEDIYTEGDAVQISYHGDHGCTLTEDNNVYCWAAEWDNTPNEAIINYEGGDAIAVETSSNRTCILKENNTTQCWGQDTGNGEMTPYTEGDIWTQGKCISDIYKTENITTSVR